MAVYVNKLKARFGGLTLCHLLADSVAELHGMARSLGIEPRWFQPFPYPHYDISVSKRDRAVELGAIAIDRHRLEQLAARWVPKTPEPAKAPVGKKEGVMPVKNGVPKKAKIT